MDRKKCTKYNLGKVPTLHSLQNTQTNNQTSKQASKLLTDPWGRDTTMATVTGQALLWIGYWQGESVGSSSFAMVRMTRGRGKVSL